MEAILHIRLVSGPIAALDARRCIQVLVAAEYVHSGSHPPSPWSDRFEFLGALSKGQGIWEGRETWFAQLQARDSGALLNLHANGG